MEKLYDLIKDDIEVLTSFDKDDDCDFLDFVSVNLSEARIKKLYQLIQQYYAKKNLDAFAYSFPFAQINDLEDKNEEVLNALNEAESALGEEDVNELINEVNKIDKKDFNFSAELDKPSREDIEKRFNDLDKTLEKTLKLSNDLKTNMISQANLFDKFKGEVSRLILDGSRAGVFTFDENDNLYKTLNDYVKNPLATYTKLHYQVFEDDSEISEYENEVGKDVLNNDKLVKENSYMDKFDEYKFNDSDHLATEIVNSVMSYIRDGRNENAEYPNLGRFLFDLKNKVTDVMEEGEIFLGDNEKANFVKNFLYNPINSFTGLIDENIKNYDERDLLRNRLIDDEDSKIDFQGLINDQKDLKLIFAREADNYNNAAFNQPDRWSRMQNANSRFFEKFLKEGTNTISIAESLHNNKGGFFENLFGTTSKEYKEFSKSLDIMVKNGPLKGDLDGLKDKTEAYLKHKLKNYDVDTKIPEKDILKLDSTSRGRVRLCISVLDAIEKAEKAASEINNLNLNAKKVEDFQNNIKEDSEIENQKKFFLDDLEEDNIIENEVNK